MIEEIGYYLIRGNWIIIATLTVVAIVTCVIYYESKFSYWKKRGFPQISTRTLPFFGHTASLLIGRKSFLETFNELYKLAGDLPYVGFFQGSQPCVLVQDLEFIKSILIKDFHAFTDRAFEIDEDIDPLNGKGLVSLKGQRWKDMRARLSPTFTSGRMKAMLPLMQACGDELVQCLKTEIEKNRGETLIEAKDFFACYSTDVIATCAFGIRCDALQNPETSEFRRMGKLSFKPTFKRRILFALLFISPKLLKILGLRFTDDESSVFFRNFVKDIMESREAAIEKNEENAKGYGDFIHHLILLKKRGLYLKYLKDDEDDDEEKEHLDKGKEEKGEIKAGQSWTNVTLDDITAQVMLFFSAGFETTSSLMSFALYELSCSDYGKQIQQRLREQIDKVMAEDGGKITYQGLKRMELLDRTLNETLRIHSPGGILSRVVTQPYTIPGTNFVLEKGTQIFIMMQSMQLDDKFFPDAKKFDPDRFLPENKTQWNQFAYLPFGEGPRICIGQRFALLQIQLGLAVLLANFEFDLCHERTSVPMKYDRKAFVLKAEGGIWLKATLRKNMHQSK